MDASQTLRFALVFVLCGIAGAHSFSIHMLEAQRILSMKRLMYLIYSTLLGIFAVFGFVLMAVSIGFDGAVVKAPAYELLSIMLLIAYAVTALANKLIKP